MKIEKRKKAESFMKGVVVLMVSQVLIKLLGLVYKLYLTNREGFGDEGNAIYSSGFQIYALLLTLSSIGVPNAISKLVSERVAVGDHKGAHRVFKIAFLTFGILGLLGTLALFFGANYIANVALQIPEAELTLVALSPSIFFVAIASVVRGYFNGRQHLSVTARSQTLEQVFKTLLTVIVVEIVALFYGLNTTLMAAGANLATTISIFLSFGYLFLYYRNTRKEIASEIKNTVNYKPERIKVILKSILYVSIPISLSAIMTSLGKNIDSITVVRSLKMFMTEQEAKIQYGILSGKVDTLITLPLSFNVAFATALVPAIASARAKKDLKSSYSKVESSLLITMLIGLPCTLGMFVFAEPIIGLLFPNATAGTLLLQISSFTILFSVLTQTINGALQGLGKVIIPAVSGAIGLIAKLILNLILVPNPEFGANGAAIASVVNIIVAFMISYVVLIKNMKLNLKFSKFIVKPCIATGIMCVCSYFVYNLLYGMHPGRIATIVALVLAVIIYVIAVVVLKIFNKQEIEMLPGGNKIYRILERLGIYRKEQA